MKDLGQQVLERMPSPEEERASLGRVWTQVERTGGRIPDDVLRDIQRVPRGQRRARVALMTAAAAMLALAVGTAMLWPRGDTVLHRIVDGTVPSGDSALYRIVDGTVRTGDRIQARGGGAQLALLDGSRVEMRSLSELSVERADDGLRIRLNKGGIIVHAADQRVDDVGATFRRPGHLYVQTKDVTVSVVGTVFLVNAGEDGSRVAVIEGEVHVQQGATKTTLLPGQQVATNPSMDARPVRESIAWSRNAGALVTLLQQSAVIPPAITGAQDAPVPIAQNATVPVDAFEVASIRPSAAPAGGGRGGGGGGGSGSPCSGVGRPLPALASGRLENGVDWEIDPRRFAVRSATLHALIMSAYGKDCLLVSGGPDWAASDRYDIDALIPEGSESYTVQQFRNGEAPKLQSMLRTLLADRFKLALRRELKDTQVYNLVVVEEGKMKPATGPAPDPRGTPVLRLTTMALGKMLTRLVDRLVIDRTELTGSFDVLLESVSPAPGSLPADGSSRFTALQQLGLKLEAAREPVEALVVERAERPSEN